MDASWTLLSQITENVIIDVTKRETLKTFFSPWNTEYLDKKLSTGSYCIELAIRKQNETALRYLLEKGASSEFTCQDGNSPEQLAESVSDRILTVWREAMGKSKSDKPFHKSFRKSSRQSSRQISPKLENEVNGKASSDRESRVANLMKKYIEKASQRPSAAQEKELLNNARSIAIDSSPCIEGNVEAWRVPIRMFRHRETLLGLMMLSRIYDVPDIDDVSEAITNSNETAFFYLATVTGFYPTEEFEKGCTQFLPNARKFLESRGSDNLLKLPSGLVSMWKELASFDSIEAEQELLDDITTNNNEVALTGMGSVVEYQE